MPQLRYPLKMKVQDPAQKVYVLLQAAIARLDMKDFSLRVEQAELVESGLRVLSALKELSIAIGHGSILEHTILLDRALRLRMWEVGYGSVFYQCAGLLVATRNGLIMRGVRTLADVMDGCTVSKLQGMLDCNSLEGRQILQLAKTLHQSTMTVQANTVGGMLTVHIHSLHWNSDSQLAARNETSPTFQLLAYCAPSSELLCYRKVDLVGGSATYTVPLKTSGVGIEHIRCSLLSNYVGIDAYQLETQPAAVSRVTPSVSRVTPSATATAAAAESIVVVPRKSLQKQQFSSSSPNPTAGKKVEVAAVAVSCANTSIGRQAPSEAAMKQCTLDRTFKASASATMKGNNSRGPAVCFDQYRYRTAEQDCDLSPSVDFSTPTARKTTAYAHSQLPVVDLSIKVEQLNPTPTATRGHTAAAVVSGDLQVIRRKALELNLDQVQVKRIRSNMRGQQPSPNQHDFSSPCEFRIHQSLDPHPQTAMHCYSTAAAPSVRQPTRSHHHQQQSSSSFFVDNNDDIEEGFFSESSTIGCHRCPEEELWSCGREEEDHRHSTGTGLLIASSELSSPDIPGLGMMIFDATDSCNDYDIRNVSRDDCQYPHEHTARKVTTADYNNDHDYRDAGDRHFEAGLLHDNAISNHDCSIRKDDVTLIDRTFDDLFF